MATVRIVVSIDTEEDDWDSVREPTAAENVRELPRLAELFARLGVRPTYFVTYQVANRPWAADMLRQLTAGGRGEIGAHLHPWNTPPSTAEPRHFSMLCHYDEASQLAKVRALTATLAASCRTPLVSFRAGRFGANGATIAAIAACGYRVDSSVTPFVSWRRIEEGPDFIGAPLSVYRVGGRRDIRAPAGDGAITEVPLTSGFNALDVRRWTRLATLFENAKVRRIPLPGLLSRLGLVRRVTLSPESATVADMLRLSRRVLAAGVEHLHMFFHSSSLRPGLTPFTRTRSDVERLIARIPAFFDGLAASAEPVFLTVSEAGGGLEAPVASGGPARDVDRRPGPR